jgi:hypothetical protein
MHKRKGFLKQKAKKQTKRSPFKAVLSKRHTEKRCGGAEQAAAGKPVKKRLDLKRYSKLKKEVRNNMKPPMGQYTYL